jgi:hypothetical protein
VAIASKIARVVLITLRNDLFVYVSDTSILPISAETVVGGGGGGEGLRGVNHGRMNYKDTEPYIHVGFS